MRPLLDEYGVTVVALSKDSQELAGAHRERDALTFDLLSDPDVSIIKRFGLLHEGALEFFTWYLAGHFPMGYPTGFKQMAIPTTVILDEDGIVRWIDQAEDYRLRGDRTRTEGALREAFGETTG
jgi:peroxiredoxin